MGAAKRAPRVPDDSLAGMPCAVCGLPSVGWVYTTMTDEDGNDVLEAYSACDAHRLEVIEGADSQAS